MFATHPWLSASLSSEFFEGLCESLCTVTVVATDLAEETRGESTTAAVQIGAGDASGVALVKLFELGGGQLVDLPAVPGFETRTDALQT